MRVIKGILISLACIVLISISSLYLTGNGFMINAIKRTYLAGNKTANINDHKAFDVATLKAGNKTPLPKHKNYNTTPLSADFLAELNKYNTAALLIIKDGQVLSEHYLNGYNERSKTNSFSMAKTITAMLLGIAIGEGHISGLNQPITDFLPEFKDDLLAQKATIGHLAKMNSGYEWDENYYSPLSPTVELLYGDDVADFLLQGHFSVEPGEFWEYSSASTQLMGIFISRALQKSGAAKSLSDYLSRKIWQPLEMNDDALWHVDGQSMELVFCCLNTNARNFAKLGLLMMNQGQWNGQQIVPADFVKKMISPTGSIDGTASSKGPQYYGLSTWLAYDNNPAFFWLSGHLGQYVINIPEHNMVIVRLGEFNNKSLDYRKPTTIPDYISKTYIKQALELIK